MIQNGILKLDDIYDMLGPSDDVIVSEAEKEIADAKETVRKMNVLSTANKDAKHEYMDTDAINIKDVRSKALRSMTGKHKTSGRIDE